jgi:hypothetical protein
LANKEDNEKQKRMREIEDRKIEIILEIPKINDDIEKMIQLNHEYVQLGDEYYNLFIEVIKAKQRA